VHDSHHHHHHRISSHQREKRIRRRNLVETFSDLDFDDDNNRYTTAALIDLLVRFPVLREEQENYHKKATDFIRRPWPVTR
jgi:hypothetical protein